MKMIFASDAVRTCAERQTEAASARPARKAAKGELATCPNCQIESTNKLSIKDLGRASPCPSSGAAPHGVDEQRRSPRV
jgi:hypothetical protein